MKKRKEVFVYTYQLLGYILNHLKNIHLNIL